jgi:hypothetical protein
MDILLRFLTQTLSENMEDLHRSEMLRNLVYMMQYDT